MKSNESGVLSNAERQKRYRERNKVTDSVTRVTEKVTEGARVTPGIPIEGMTVKSEVVIAETESSRTMDVVIPPKTKKGFADLPKDVQQNILRVSNMRIGNVDPDPKLVDEEIGRRTQAALDYQAMYPDRATTVEVVKEPVVCSENS